MTKKFTEEQQKELEHLRQQIQMIFNLTDDYKNLLLNLGCTDKYQPMAEVTRYRLVLHKKMKELEDFVTGKYYINTRY